MLRIHRASCPLEVAIQSRRKLSYGKVKCPFPSTKSNASLKTTDADARPFPRTRCHVSPGLTSHPGRQQWIDESRWLRLKKGHVDSLIGVHTYDTWWEPAVLYLTCITVLWLVLWGALIQLKNAFHLLVAFQGTLVYWLRFLADHFGALQSST